MKRAINLMFFIVLCGLLIFTSYVFGNIQGSKHDFSARGWSNGEVCLPCHTPHNADTTQPNSPLWNHQLTNATFTLYNSLTLVVAPEQPRGPTKLCLSCHDGTVAVDSYDGNTGSEFASGTVRIGTDLSNDHPVSIKWIHQNDFSGSGTCLNCHSLHPSAFISELPFFEGYIECATCHDVHNGASYTKLLRKTLQGSELCLHCHGK